jgi:hypothetical protein
VPSSFCVGVTINSVDSVFPEILVDRVRQLELVTSAGVDFIEISGGTFEDPLVSISPEALCSLGSWLTKRYLLYRCFSGLQNLAAAQIWSTAKLILSILRKSLHQSSQTFHFS